MPHVYKLNDEGRRRVDDHMDVARRMAWSRWKRCRWIDREDLIGAAVYGLCRASAAWMKRRCPFEMFAVQVIDLELRKEIRRWSSGMSPDVPFEDGGEYLVEALQMVDDEVLHAAFARLPEGSREILSRVVIRGERVPAAASALGMSKGRLRRQMSFAKKRLQKLLTHPSLLTA